LMQGGAILQDPVLVEIARKYGKTTAQVILRWDLQRGVVTIPKSVKPKRIAENADVFDFNLTASEMAAVDRLDHHERAGPDPLNFGF
jgi:diketogulonate reductase-like aldo/keto reductase